MPALPEAGGAPAVQSEVLAHTLGAASGQSAYAPKVESVTYEHPTTGVQVAGTIPAVEWAIFLVLLGVTLATGLEARWVDKTFGGTWDFVWAFVWGAGGGLASTELTERLGDALHSVAARR